MPPSALTAPRLTRRPCRRRWLLAHECGWFSNVVVGFACVRWTAWSTIYLVYWVEAHSGNPAKGRWGEGAREGGGRA